MQLRKLLPVLAVSAIVLPLALSACGGSSTADSVAKIRAGYFPNITHAQALVGIARGDFAKELGSVQIETKVFNAGPSAIEALLAGALDITYVGPNPAINGYMRSSGSALRVVAGAASGGAVFVVRPESGINGPADLSGKRIATPQLGNTQDVALRNWLAQNGLKSKDKGGTVDVIPTENPNIFTLFSKGDIDGAWVPEPWGARLVAAGGQILIDERDLWPNGQFTTAIVVARKDFLDEHPDLVKKWLSAHVAVTEWIKANPAEAQATMNKEIARLTGKPLPEEVIEGAMQRLEITYDPVGPSIPVMAQSAFDLGFLGRDKPDVSGITDLRLLNEVIKDKGLKPVQ